MGAKDDDVTGCCGPATPTPIIDFNHAVFADDDDDDERGGGFINSH